MQPTTLKPKNKGGRPSDPDSLLHRVGYTTIRIDKETRDRLNLIAEKANKTLAKYLRDHARAKFNSSR